MEKKKNAVEELDICYVYAESLFRFPVDRRKKRGNIDVELNLPQVEAKAYAYIVHCLMFYN